MMPTKIILGAAAVALAIGQSTKAALIESFENTLDGYTLPQASNYTVAFSNTTGVTNGTYSLALTAAASPNYGQLLLSPSTLANTALLANSSSLSFDVFTPAGSFGYLQFDVDINNNDTGYTSLDGYSYAGVTVGSETTITVPVSTAIRAQLAASANTTAIIIQAGGGSSAANEPIYIDNIRTVDVVAAPEPASLGALGLVGVAAMRRRRAAV